MYEKAIQLVAWGFFIACCGAALGFIRHGVTYKEPDTHYHYHYGNEENEPPGGIQ